MYWTKPGIGVWQAFSLAWLDRKEISEDGLERLIGSGFKKGCVLLYYFSIEFDSTLTVYCNGKELPGCPVQTLPFGSSLF
jgi:hypothetical protein